MKQDKAIVWFRNDLRIHDNEALWEASNSSAKIIPVYIFDTRFFEGKLKFGMQKTGVYRTQFIIESIENLRKSFQKKGSDIVVRVGIPELILPDLCADFNVSWIYCNRERTQEEVDIQNELEQNLWKVGKELRFSRGKMLYYTADLPFPIAHTPDVFSNFRKEVERFIKVREPLPSESLTFDALPEEIELGEIPTIQEFHKSFPEGVNRLKFPGGETEALSRLRYYLWESRAIENYKDRRNELLGLDYSSKFSAYLSLGCISPKTIYNEISKYEEERVSNESTYWLKFELLWRDFFRLMGKKHGNNIFKISGTQKDFGKSWSEDITIFNQWAKGETGIPFIDANMKELNSTGFMSNRGRQNVASFLVNDLGINWLMGAEYFESLLIDYDPCSNYGNWNYLAGVGSDPRVDRMFNIYSQAKRYDPTGDFVKEWLPILNGLSDSNVHLPSEVDGVELEASGVILGENYPKPIVNTAKWNR